jgi:glycosyltransferase involved in cell wall biosynthesis
MVMIEAMALGCPIITFARGAAPEIVVDGVTGFLVDSVDEMVHCMPRIDEIDRAAVRRHVERHFSARVMAEKYIEIYRRAIAMQMVSAIEKLDEIEGATLANIH